MNDKSIKWKDINITYPDIVDYRENAGAMMVELYKSKSKK